ncbi:MAG TPA: HAMP domain-containing sensor histidine kinase [Sphingomicrobium sp.]|nr:HAMP domain-containing sensor histidine kinase [Sphingomicrobium sp.]
MASAPSDPPPVLGRVDRNGRLVAADPELAALQAEAGSSVGSELALPQIAAIARLARKLGVPVSRPAVAAGADQDYELWVRATPDGDDVALALERWTAVPARRARLTGLVPTDADLGVGPAAHGWVTDEQLRVVSLSPELAAKLGVELGEVLGEPLTKLFKLEENDSGEMPMLVALASRTSFAGQRAQARGGDKAVVMLKGEGVIGADGGFAGFKGSAEPEDQAKPAAAAVPAGMVDQMLDQALRAPLDRIIESADRIAERSDGPLRSDYAAYASDISAAARHLLSVIRSMGEESGGARDRLNLAALASEAAGLLEQEAEAADIRIAIEPAGPLSVYGESRGIIQILVNLIGNAVRHSPAGSTVAISFEVSGNQVQAHVSDNGPGIDPADHQRIFERFQRAKTTTDGSGLGLAIARRLARSMGGDILIDSEPGKGARFTLSLPAA